ncbi:MAG: glycosyltransferase, partial [Chloroflexi bacterium]|nr:glycosyltransferase [Chloroflexota bacterium]
LEPFADPAVQGAKGVYETAQTALVARLVQFEYHDKYRRMAGEPRIDFVDTYSAAYRRSTFLRFGGFDTRFPGASVEDQELSFRMAEAGCKMVFAPLAVVRHIHAATLPDYLRKKFRIGFWKVLVHARHPGKLQRDSHTPPSLKLQIPLIYAAAALTVSWAMGRTTGRWPAAAWSLFGLTGGGSAWAARRDPVAAAATLPFHAARGLALGAGLAAGLADLFLFRRRMKPQRRGPS